MKIQLSIKATNLDNNAGAFKGTSDPFAVILALTNDRDSKPQLIGKTEVLKNTLEPDWVTTFRIDYDLGKPMNILVKLYDEVSKGDNIPMGSGVFDLGAILGAKGNVKGKKIKDTNGKIFLRAEKAIDHGSLRLKLSGIDFTNTDGWFNKSDPFYQFTKLDQGLRGSEYNVVYKSPYVKDDLNPNWEEGIIDIYLLCNGDLDANLKLGIYDNESSGDHILMGEIETSVNNLILLHSSGSEAIDLLKEGEKTGSIVVHVAEMIGGDEYEVSEDDALSKVRKPTFVDYISGGCEMNLCVAIDFTGSNGDPRCPGTLHYMDPDGSKNDYQKAINSIGTILANYDPDKKFPVWGFGARYDGEVQHCFDCGSTSEVEGVDGILKAYNKVFESGLILSGPTVFTEVIETAAAFAHSSQEEALAQGKQKYTTLLILTDGVVSDVAATASCLGNINAPLSIVIVGIGNADFSAMQFLDDQSSGIDIAQFVDFNSHKHSCDSLTRATLDEIPKQLENYCIRNGIVPNPPVETLEEEIIIEPEEEEIDLTLDFGSGEREITVADGGFYNRNTF